ncbi:MAG TPA: acyl-CoA dehydrogenase family protein [Acidimicrobiia bacterium]|nr:acyl-CoA dehydrogenase family protein [Acidimicrobiia bacterium]
MDLELSPDQQFFVETTRRFLEAETPVASVRAREGDPAPFDRDWWRQGAELGWTSMLVPEDLGGGSLSGDGLLDLVLVAEEMGRVVAPGALTPVNVVADTLARSGSPDHHALLPSIVAGDTIATWAFLEPARAWDVARLELSATPDGDEFVLDGTKVLVESGAIADLFLVTTATDGNPTQFLVPAAAAGLSVEDEDGIDLARRHSTVVFSAVRVPRSAVVGEVGGAADDVARQLQVAVVLQVAETCGVMTRVLDFTIEYLGDRYSFGRPLSSYQALKHRVADMKMWVEASLGVAGAAARAVQHDDPEAEAIVRAAASYVGERATDLVQDCVQLHGGIGVTWEHDLHLYLRRATVNRFTYGTPDEHRESLAALELAED